MAETRERPGVGTGASAVQTGIKTESSLPGPESVRTLGRYPLELFARRMLQQAILGQLTAVRDANVAYWLAEAERHAAAGRGDVARACRSKAQFVRTYWLDDAWTNCEAILADELALLDGRPTWFESGVVAA